MGYSSLHSTFSYYNIIVYYKEEHSFPSIGPLGVPILVNYYNYYYYYYYYSKKLKFMDASLVSKQD
jgi:hypothetical protein